MGKSLNTMFCPDCQVEIEVVMAPTAAGGKLVPRCTICGTVIKEDDQSADKGVSFDEVSFVDESISVPGMERVLVVGYTQTVRQLIVDKMMEKNLAREIMPVNNGEEMIIEVIGRLANGELSGKIDLLVTDVPMPFLNGINAAIGLRAVERTYSEHDLIPILFLTNKPCDETFKKVIRFLAPAKYATLGPVDDQAKLVKHLQKILTLVARETW